MDYTIFMITHLVMVICAITVFAVAFKLSSNAKEKEDSVKVKKETIQSQNLQLPILTLPQNYKAIDENVFQLKAS